MKMTYEIQKKSQKLQLHHPSASLLAISITFALWVFSMSLSAQVTNTKSVDKSTAVPGDPLNYSITVGNQGSTLLENVTLRDFVPFGTSFVSAGQGGTLTTFSSLPGTTGTVNYGGTVARVYAFRGGNTPTFWGYNPGTSLWDQPLPDAPGNITTGAAMTSDGERYVYAFQGGSRAFYRYDAVNKIWSDAAVADLPTGAPTVGDRGALVHLDGFVYAFIGGSSQFWRYSVSGNSWTQMTSTSANVGAGASLATDGTNIFGLHGGGTQTFRRYNVSDNTWTDLTNTGANVGAGTGLVLSDDGVFYATIGGTTGIREYNPETNVWTGGLVGGTPGAGGGLATNGTIFYQLLGGSTTTFVDRKFSGSNVTLAAAPATVSAGGAMTYLESPVNVGTSQMDATPNVRKLGESFTVTLTLMATSALTNVTPSTLQITGGTATIIGPSPSSANLTANVPQTYTWTVTPNNVGEFVFSAEATDGTVVFEAASSNSVLVSPDGQNQFVQWSLGSSTPGTTGLTTNANYIYGLRGNTQPAFWAYNIGTGNWNNPLDPADVGVNVVAGGAMASDGQRYIYAFQGGNRVFLRYTSVSGTGTWSNPAVADLPAGAPVTGAGASMVYLDGYVYAWMVGGSNHFWRYNVATDTWQQMANTLATVLSGASLTTDGTFIYGTRGGATQTFWRYSPATNTWVARANTTRNFEPGSSIAYSPDGFIYALAGKHKRFYRYTIATNTWTRMTDGPANFKLGASLVFAQGNLYAFQGDNKSGFYRYNIATNNWTSLTAAPANVGGGGSLVYHPFGDVAVTSASVTKNLIGGSQTLTLRMTVTSESAYNNITANTPTFTATGGASASFSSASLISTDNNISGAGDPVIYEWTVTVTPGASIGQIVFTVSNSLANSSAKSMSVLVTPLLTWQASINTAAPYPPLVVDNTAILNDIGGSINNYPSNITHTDVPCQLEISTSKIDVDCFGADNGSIDLTVTNATGSYTVEWSGPDSYSSNDEDITGLSPGPYTVTVTDARGCTETDAVTINEPPLLSFLTSKVHIQCYGESNGSITVNASGGTPPYQYKLDAGSYGSSNVFNGLAADSYTVWVKDSKGCETSAVVTINQPAELTASLSLTDPSCFLAGSIVFQTNNPSGGTPPYTYDWADLGGSNNPNNRLGIPAGTYSVTVTDAHGCTWSSGNLTLSPASGCLGVTVCKEDNSSVFTTSPDPDVSTYEWSIKDFDSPPNDYSAAITSGQNTPAIVINWNGFTPGAYQVCVIAHNICGTSDETCQTVYVNQTVAEIQADPVCEGGELHLFASGGASYLWSGPNSFSSSSPNPIIYDALASLHNGTYYVTVTGAAGCTASASVVVSVNPTPSVSGSVSPSSCGMTNGIIDLTVSGGTGSYAYAWSNGAITEDLTGISSGIYSVTVTDNVGCSQEVTYAVGDNDGPEITVDGTDLDCAGDTDGTATATITTATTSPYTYAWSNGITSTTANLSHTITGLDAGVYSVVVTDNNGCVAAGSVTLIEPDPLDVDYTKIDIACYGLSTGSITLLVSGGTPNYSYEWSGPTTIGDIANPQNLSAGIYYVTITDAKNCKAYATITLNQPAEALSVSETVADVKCFGGTDGQIVLNVSGGTAPYTYLWSGPNPFSATTKDIINLVAGTYYVTVTDAKACQYIINDIEVDEPDVLTVDASAKTDVSCFGGADGTITLSVGGGTPDYTYLWSNGATTQNLSGLAIGTYTVTVTDSKGCTETASNTITQPTLLTASATPTDADCYGAFTGSIVLTVNGGTPFPETPPDDYTYSWSNSATSKDLSGLLAGTYNVTVTDSKGCTAQASATVNQPDPITVSAVVTNVLCNGAATGGIDLSVGGGAGSFTFDWADLTPPPVEPDDRSGLTAGTYTITITDANSCQEVRSYTITQPTALSLSATPSDISCYGGADGSINLSVSGAVAPYSYSWAKDGNGFSATTEDITGLSAGTYSVTVTDANLCTATLSGIAVNQPSELILNLSLVNNVTCKGGSDGSAFADVSGGTAPYSYLWSNGSTVHTPANFIAGTYGVVVTDAKGCVVSDNIVITQPAEEIELYATVRNTSWCASGTGAIDLIVVNGVGTLYFLWSNNETTEDISGLDAGTYSVTVTDGLGCTAVLSNITVGTAPTMTVSLVLNNPSCFGNDGEVYAIVSGGVSPYTYSWSTTAASSYISGLGAGTYDVTVTDADLCWVTASGSLTAPTCNPPVAVDDYFTTCGETLNETVADNDNLQGIPLSDMEFLPLTFPAPEQGTLDWGTDYDGSFTFIPTPGYTGIVEIRYLVEDTFGLSDEGKLIIYVSQVIAEITAANTSHVECGATDGSATVTHTGGFPPYEYAWSTTPEQTSATASNLGAGTYTVSITDDKDCIVTVTVTIENICLTITKTLKSINGDVSETEYNIAGDVLAYDILITNTGTATLEDIVVTDILPGVSVSGSPIVSLAPSASASLTASYTVVAADLVAKQIDNTAKAAFTYNGESYEYSDSETVLMGDADVTITKSASPDPAVAGQPLTYTITVTNNGPAAALNVTITDNPVHFSSPGYSLTGSAPWTPWTGSLNVGTLAPLQSYTVYLNDVVHPYECGPLSNTASVTTTSNDGNDTNDESIISTNVTNSSPDAVDDNYTMEQNTLAAPTSLTANVLSNDSDPEGQPMLVSSWGTPSVGTLTSTNPNGVFTYTPPVDYVGTVTFTYVICDPCPGCDTATVTIVIEPCFVAPPRPGVINKAP